MRKALQQVWHSHAPARQHVLSYSSLADFKWRTKAMWTVLPGSLVIYLVITKRKINISWTNPTFFNCPHLLLSLTGSASKQTLRLNRFSFIIFKWTTEDHVVYIIYTYVRTMRVATYLWGERIVAYSHILLFRTSLKNKWPSCSFCTPKTLFHYNQGHLTLRWPQFAWCYCCVRRSLSAEQGQDRTRFSLLCWQCHMPAGPRPEHKLNNTMVELLSCQI